MGRLSIKIILAKFDCVYHWELSQAMAEQAKLD
jgi:hypothetical protein